MPCKPKARCRVGCLHAEFVQGYREERQRQEAIAEDMYDAEREEWLRSHPMVTFKEWLAWHAYKRAY